MKAEALSQFRRDIQGLRGISILLVLLFHVSETLVPAGFLGVDVFFVVSGYIITSLLLREHRQSGKILLLAFWARRAKRLLPNATLVLVFVIIVGALTLPGFRFDPLATDVTSAAVYLSNFHFADIQTNYFTSNRAPSPVIHYWSLSVEEQFYLVWPIVLVAINAVGGQHRFRTLVSSTLVLIAIASFSFCVSIAQHNQPLAFFHTGARVWELAAGALLAIHADKLSQVFSSYRTALGLVGLAAILLSAILLNEYILHPGFWTLIPVAGTVLVIAAGGNEAPLQAGAATRLLAAAPLRWLGDRSYSIYLWHWPVLVFARDLWPGQWWTMPAAVLTALALAELAFRFVEKPVRESNLFAGRIGIQLAAASVLILGASCAGPATAHVSGILRSSPGGNWSDRIKIATEDTGTNNKTGCHLDGLYTVQPDCLFGRPDAERTAVIMGDSHAAHWFGAIEKAAWIANWKFHAWSKSLCPASMIHGWNPRRQIPYTECDEWRNLVLKRILASEKKLLVFLAGSNDYSGFSVSGDGQVLRGPAAPAAYEQGLEQIVKILLDNGHYVAIIRDTPLADVKYKECIVHHQGGSGCERPRNEALNSNLMEKRVADKFPSAAYIDVADQMCGQHNCPVVIDGIIVYRDDSHMTATFAATLYRPFLDVFTRFSR